MNITELIEKYVSTDRKFEERFHALAVKEALGTVTKEELSQLERMDKERDSQVRNEMNSDNLKQFAIELLEMIERRSKMHSLETHRAAVIASDLDKALEELRK